MSAEDREQSDDDIAEGVLPVRVSEVAVPMALDKLQPWHRPRKQFIRERQWVARSKLLLEHVPKSRLPVNADGNREIRYLTLPGIDYLDVVELGRACRTEGLQLTSTSFFASHETSRSVARAQVREEALIGEGVITRHSQTFYRRFEEIETTTGAAYKELVERGPFQVVNIDACGSIAPADYKHPQRLIEALHRLIEFQLDACSTRWVLFVTSDVRKENFSDETLERLYQAIRMNARSEKEFEEGFIQLLSADAPDFEEALRIGHETDELAFIKCFSLGLAKWMLHLAGEKNWSLKVHQSYFYSTDGADTAAKAGQTSRPTMPCLAFEFLPPEPGLRDRFQASKAAPLPTKYSENFSLRALSKVSEMLDLDAMMLSDSELSSEMKNRMRTELAAAGYAAEALEQLG
ncbi:MAG: hypothetical protein AAF291_01180 [Pseudomonadota bacterium]